MTTITNAFDELKWRGMVYDYMEGVDVMLAKEKVTVYNGFDATGDSLHVGHMVPLLALARLQRFGHHPIALAGGGTSMIGDPSGKSAERILLTQEVVNANLESIKGQLSHFLDFNVKTNPARVMNNADWLLKLNLVDFLRDIGKHFTINYMLSKDSVKSRIDREEGISFTEFSYMLMQSYDFLHLHEHENCFLQTGGSDQWGNITAGAELVRKVRGKPAYGMVYPLITKSDGTKFGKTESGSIWLKPDRTSPYKFYQFWLNTDDRDVVNYLKYFTFLSQDQIAELALAVAERPEQRDAQRKLAQEITLIVHGETALSSAEQATQVLFGGSMDGLSAADIEEIFADVPSIQMSKDHLTSSEFGILDLLVESGIAKSKGEARRSVQEGGINLNNQRVNDLDKKFSSEDLLEGRFMVLRKGRKNYQLIKVMD
ncbi:MAG: tyrosine--tRNA ligase [Chloroflexi bacterium HGW-Chloroflexi-10]|nr:MAG: tyrosine--tRNA ligase [Chloroflexi bacterium HGW-Chloroflexi-10]